MSFNPDVKLLELDQKLPGPVIIEALTPKLCAIKWAESNKNAIEAALLRHKTLVLRNFEVGAISGFNRFVQTLGPELLEYNYRSTPRTKLGGKIYTATEYPADRSIPQHNENSYTNSWPTKLYFYCVVLAASGGRTPIADSGKIYKEIDPSIRAKFEEHGVLYVRNYTPGIDLSWQEVFQTDNKHEVGKFCRSRGIEYIWGTKGPELTTKQVCQAVLTHPTTQEKVWFNQAHLFHHLALDIATAEVFLSTLGKNALPRNTFYGNGDPIDRETIEHINAVYAKNMVRFDWKREDIMILDNIAMSHGREPYTGERKIAVAMS